MGFRISALDVNKFSYLFGLDDEALLQCGVRRMVADSKPGYPCRVSLQDADVGETVLLMNYEHQAAPTPYRSSHAIFVREWAEQAVLESNEVPNMLRSRFLSVRAFDDPGMMVEADVVEGEQLESMIERMLTIDMTDYLHIHNAKLGCYAARVDRD